MPTYDFYCKKCKKDFSIIISISEYEKKKFKCPKCKGKELKQQITSFQTVTSEKKLNKLSNSNLNIEFSHLDIQIKGSGYKKKSICRLTDTQPVFAVIRDIFLRTAIA